MGSGACVTKEGESEELGEGELTSLQMSFSIKSPVQESSLAYVEPILIGYKVLMITNTNEILLECIDQTSFT